MQYEEVKAMCYRINELYNQHDLAALSAMHAPDFKFRSSAFPGGVADLEGLKAFMTMQWNAFADMHNAIQDMVIEGETAVVRLLITGTQTGDFQGFPASGKQVSATVIDISRYENGLVKEEWTEYNPLVMAQQIGMMPA